MNELEQLLEKLNNCGSKYIFNLSNNEIRVAGEYPIYVRKDYNGYYSFYLRNKLEYSQGYIKEIYELKKPKNVKVLSAKKVNDWVEYYIDEYNLRIAEYFKNKKIVDDFLDEFKKLGEVEESNYSFNGNLSKNYIKYWFEIDKRTGHIRQDIKLEYGLENNLLNFIKLSNNEIN